MFAVCGHHTYPSQDTWKRKKGKMSLPHWRRSTEETDHVREYSADTAVEFVPKLEPAWSMDEDSPDQPSAVYSTEQPMSDHTSLLSLDSMHLCYLCPAAFVLVSSLELHLVSVHGEILHVVLPGSYTPDRCDAGNCSNTDIEKKVNIHDNRKTPGNEMDDHDTGDKDGKKRSKQHECDVCSKSFYDFSTLRRHKLIHSGVKAFVCDVCSKSFTQAGDLTMHKRVHTGTKPYKCPHCDKDFKQSSHLQLHIKSVHEGAKPHICDVCGAAFSQSSSLTVHRKTHTGEKPHVCSECGKGFARSSHLANHRLTHTGQKPHSCPHCPSAFTQSHSLRKHIRRKHQ